MFIQTESTPNPTTLKFLPGRVVLESGTAEFLSAEQAQSSPLQQRCLKFRASPASITASISLPLPRTAPNGST